MRSSVRRSLTFLFLLSTGVWIRATEPASASFDRIWKGEFAAAAAPRADLRLVDWNIDRGARLDQIAAELASQQPDLCFLQEADLFARRSGTRNVSERLAQRLKLNYVFAPSFQELSQGTSDQPSFQGEAILSRLPIRNVRVLRFQEQSGFWKPRAYLPDWPIMQRRLGGRIALIAELEWAGRMLVVYDTHLESRSFGRIQSLQLDEILKDARRYPEDTPIVLAGDLNSKYNAGAFAAKLREAGWRSAFGDRTPRTHTRIWWCLDWILVRGPLDIEGGKAIRGTGASDHLPVTAEIRPFSAKSGSTHTP